MIPQRRWRLPLFIVCLVVAEPLLAQQRPPADLDAYVGHTMKVFEVPGMAIAVVTDGKVVLLKGYGLRELGKPAAVDENTLFGIGSNTKAFTAAALATLVDEGRISWDDPVYERLKGFEMYDPYVSKEMRIRDLLCHRSGLGLGQGDLMFWPHTTFTRDDVVYRLRYLKPKTSFRTVYAYSNLMFVTAGQVAAEVSGESWDDYLRERIFLPLGMKNTNTSVRAFKAGDDWATPHSKVEGKLQPISPEILDNAGPAGSINSSVADMSKWVLLQLNRGKIPGAETRIFSERASEEMWTQQMVVAVPHAPQEIKNLQAHFAGYGLGWALRDYKGRKLVSHSGGVAGYVTRVMLVPEENLGVVILTNAEEDLAFESVLYHLLDSYLGGPTQDYVAAFKAIEDQQHKEADEIMSKATQARATESKPSLPLEKYAGDYSDPWYGKVTIRPENGGLLLNFERTEKGLADLQHWQYDTFKAHWRDRIVEDAFVTFALKPDGTIDHFTIRTSISRRCSLRGKARAPSFAQKFNLRRTGKQAGGSAALDQFTYRLLAFFAVAEGPFVDVHPDEFVGHLRIHGPRELHRIVQRFLAMLQTISHAVPNSLCDLAPEFGAEGSADGISAESKRKRGRFLPPDTEIDHALQSEFGEKELPFVNEEPGFDNLVADGLNDLVKGHHHRFEIGLVKLQGQKGAGL